MAISVKDIQEKEFATAQADGYNPDQVDDFLDALAEDWGAILRENERLSAENAAQAEKLAQLEAELAQAQADNAEMEKKLPDYNEKSYFQNLQASMREALIGAQRIADETVAEAKRQAQEAVDGAKAQAERTIAEADEHAKDVSDKAQQAVADLSAQAERLRATIGDYKTKLKSLIDEHLASIVGDDDK